jgi:hypothetical protein
MAVRDDQLLKLVVMADAVDRRCQAAALQRFAAGDREQLISKVVSETNAGYRKGLIDLRWQHIDLAEEWMAKRTALAAEFDDGRAEIGTAGERFAALLTEFTEKVRARMAECEKATQEASRETRH